LDWVAINPFVAHRVLEDGTHDVPNLRFRCSRPLNAVKPLFNCDWLDLIELEVSPTRKNPGLQIAFIGGAS